MREDANDQLALLRGGGAGGEGGPQPALVLREGALGLLPLGVQGLGKCPTHRATVGSLGPAARIVHAAIERNRRVGNAEGLATEPVAMLRVVARVGRDGGEADERRRLAHHRGEVGRIVRRPDIGHRAEDEVRGRVDRRRQFGVPGAIMRPRGAAARPVERRVGGLVARRVDVAIVRTGVARIEPRGIDRGDERRRAVDVDQALRPGASDDDLLRVAEGPPFSASWNSRRSA